LTQYPVRWHLSDPILSLWITITLKSVGQALSSVSEV
jgi:hypothetical protein